MGPIGIFASIPVFDPLTTSPWFALRSTEGTYKDSAGTTPTSTTKDPLGLWQDYSGNGRHWSRITAGDNRPSLDLNIINGLPAVRFHRLTETGRGVGIDARFATQLDGPNMSALTQGEIMMVVKLDVSPPVADADTGLWHMGNPTGTHYPYSDGSAYDAWGTTARKEGITLSVSAATWHILGVSSASGAWTMWQNSTSIRTTGTNTTQFIAAPTLGRASGGYYSNCYVAEVWTWAAPLSTDNRTAMRSYLTSRFAL